MRTTENSEYGSVSGLHLRILFFLHKMTLLMITAEVCGCVFNLSWAYVCQTYALSGAIVGNVFLQHLRVIFIHVTFLRFQHFYRAACNADAV